MLSPEQAADLLNLNASTVRRWLRSGRIAGEKYRRWWLVEEDLVLDQLARQRPEWRSRSLTGQQLRAVAHHEAGHAVADWFLSRQFGYVTIIPAGHYLGCVSYTSDPPDAPWRLAEEAAFEFLARLLVDGEDVDLSEGDRLLNKYLEAVGENGVRPERETLADPVETETAVVTALAGAIAEKRVTGIYNERGARGDHTIALGRTILLLQSADELNPDAVQAFWSRAHDRASQIVRDNWLEICALARRLLRHGQLDGHTAVAVIEETKRRFPRAESGAGRR